MWQKNSKKAFFTLEMLIGFIIGGYIIMQIVNNISILSKTNKTIIKKQDTKLKLLINDIKKNKILSKYTAVDNNQINFYIHKDCNIYYIYKNNQIKKNIDCDEKLNQRQIIINNVEDCNLSKLDDKSIQIDIKLFNENYTYHFNIN